MVKASEGDMTVALLVPHRHDTVTVCQSDGLVESVPKNVRWNKHWDIVAARYALKPNSTSRKNSSAMTVADKEGSIATPLLNGLAACAARGSIAERHARSPDEGEYRNFSKTSPPNHDHEPVIE